MKAMYFALAISVWLAGATALWAQEPEITVELPGGATMEMVWIPPGTFLMGSPEDEPGNQPNEGPQHEVTISQGFYLGKHELTQGQWASVMDTQPWIGHSVIREGSNFPAEWISWEDAQAFIHRLNVTAGDSLYRMPTEAEWEYACRAGTTTAWSFGDDESVMGTYAWFKGNTSDMGEWYTREVGQKLPNPWGLCDMHGNVLEWTQDWAMREYTTGSQVDPIQAEPTVVVAPGTDDTPARILRGGMRLFYSSGCRSAFRFHQFSPTDPGHLTGVRILRRTKKTTITFPSSWGDMKQKTNSP